MSSLAEKVAFLSDPSNYLGRTPHVTALETHMSWVFLTDRLVYKLKKPVRYPFLDFSTLTKRRHFCDEELRLNRRLADSTYLAVVPLCRSPSGALAMSREGQVVEWLVEMKRLPRSRMLDAMVLQGRVDEEDIGRIGEKLAVFYQDCSPEREDGHLYIEHFLAEQAVNRSVLQLAEPGMARRARPVLDAADAALERLRPEIEGRIASGRIVEGHGDLRPEHICLVEPLQIIDCLEFNRAMRLVDPFDEVNYLGLECEMLSAPWVRPILLHMLATRLGDRPSEALMAFYGAFRLILRARLCLAHLLEKPVRHEERWRPLAAHYIALAGQEASTLEAQKV